ncbi:MAG: sulfate ABC transporter substrate-binding protein [Pirellulales bacterium]|nr:sulfate ABC transporter substrate-binding protein [Pirellulales bacterium]
MGACRSRARPVCDALPRLHLDVVGRGTLYVLRGGVGHLFSLHEIRAGTVNRSRRPDPRLQRPTPWRPSPARRTPAQDSGVLAVSYFFRSSHLALGLLGALLFAVTGCGPKAEGSAADGAAPKAIELLNVSYDPTRELWKQINERFIAEYTKRTGQQLAINQSHGGSSSQARAVSDGLEADVVTLAMSTDTDAIQRAGLIKENWQKTFPNDSLPYYSTIVFVVRKGNPKGVKDWADLVRDDIQIVTPNPKTSGNGKLSFLAAWGSIVLDGGSEADAEAFIKKLYERTPVLDTGARGSTATFAQKKIGDVHLTWENEAHLEVAESNGELEIVYPSKSIKAEPRVALVDANVARHATRSVAEEYLQFLYTPEGQEIIAKNFYRPSNEEILAQHTDTFAPIELFEIGKLAGSWENAEKRFFADGGVFDSIYQPAK